MLPFVVENEQAGFTGETQAAERSLQEGEELFPRRECGPIGAEGEPFVTQVEVSSAGSRLAHMRGFSVGRKYDDISSFARNPVDGPSGGRGDVRQYFDKQPINFRHAIRINKGN
jgi:hypothetical protein